MFIYYVYATQTIKKYAPLAYKYYLETGTKQIKVNRILFDFSRKDSKYFTAFSKNTIYSFDVI